jgi:anti-sigma regulatory factor (Ser/Thr protein kinase)
MTNVIRHAYHSDPDRSIEINCQARTDRLEFTLFDQGDAPDPARICAQPLDDSALGGRGTHIIQMVMDEVSYERVRGGNLLRLRKSLPATAAGVMSEGKAV